MLSPLVSGEQILKGYRVEVGVCYIVKLLPHGNGEACAGAVALYLPFLYAGNRSKIILYAAEYFTDAVLLRRLVELIAALLAACTVNELGILQVSDYHFKVLHR